jgi:hypothetical protein
MLKYGIPCSLLNGAFLCPSNELAGRQKRVFAVHHKLDQAVMIYEKSVLIYLVGPHHCNFSCSSLAKKAVAGGRTHAVCDAIYQLFTPCSNFGKLIRGTYL